MISDAPVRWGASLALLLLLFLPLHHPLADDIAASSSRSLSPHCLNCAAALTAPLRTFAQQQPADVCGVDRGSCSSRPGGLTTINWTCATVHPSISAPLPVLMLLDPPRAALDRVPFAARHRFPFSGVLFSRSRDKSLTLPFSLLPILITTTTTTFCICLSPPKNGGVAFPEPLPAWDGLDSSPSALLFPFSFNIPRFSYQPLSLSPSTTYAAEAHPGRRSVFRLLSTTFFYLPKSA